MVKSKAHFDPRRDRPLATQSRGVAKRQQRREKHEDEQAGAVAKAKKPKYGTVLFGPNPAVYSNLSSFKRAERAHPDARAYQSYQLRKIEAVIAQYKASLQPQSVGAGQSRGTGPGVTHKGAVRFDTSELPRGFALGTVRMNGKATFAEAAKPLFSFTGLPMQGDNQQFPQHDTIEADKQKAQAQLLDSVPAVDASELQCGPVMISESDDDDSPEEVEDEEDEEPADEIANGLDDDFIAFGSGSGDEDDAEPQEDPAPATAAAAKEVQQWRDEDLPWYEANLQISSQTLRLHNEIVEINSLLRPVPAEDAQRLEAKGLLDALITAIFPTARLEVFGSFATGLHLPTSDVDCVILCAEITPSSTVSALRAIGQSLNSTDWATEVEVVSGAKVPIVKLVVMPYGLKFDISIGKGNGVAAVEYIRRELAAWPPLRPLVTILKLFLLQRLMNEVYTGGLSSFSLILSVIAFLKMHPSRKTRTPGQMQQLDCNLGVLLIDYFRFYGRQLDYSAVGVACGDGGFCYNKSRTFPQQARFRKGGANRGERFSIMDPLDCNNDVSGGSFGSGMVRSAFDHAYQMLTFQPPGMRDLSAAEVQQLRGRPMLGGILRLNDVLAIRPPPPRQRHGRGGGGGDAQAGGGATGARGNGKRRRGTGGSGGGGEPGSRREKHKSGAAGVRGEPESSTSRSARKKARKGLATGQTAGQRVR